MAYRVTNTDTSDDFPGIFPDLSLDQAWSVLMREIGASARFGRRAGIMALVIDSPDSALLEVAALDAGELVSSNPNDAQACEEIILKAFEHSWSIFWRVTDEREFGVELGDATLAVARAA